jgi:ADP-ribosylation factor related protein 1
MYTLLSGAYRHYFQKDEYCILILGLDDAGKTTFLEQTKTKFNQGTLYTARVVKKWGGG